MMNIEKFIKDQIDQQVPENTTLDYKRKHNEKKLSDKDKDELRKDVAAFANTSGGIIIYGVGEMDQTKKLDVVGLNEYDIPDQIQQMEQVLNTLIEPRLEGVVIKGLKYEDKFLIYVEVPESYRKPHAVIKGLSRAFYHRSHTNNVEMDVNQLRSAFNSSAGVFDQARRFRDERVNAIETVNYGMPKLVVHVVPLLAGPEKMLYRFDDFPLHLQFGSGEFPEFLISLNRRFDLDGAYYDVNNVQCHSIRLFRNGAWEGTWGYQAESPLYADKCFEHAVILSSTLLRSLSECKDTAAVIMTSLLDVAGKKLLKSSSEQGLSGCTTFPRKVVQLPEVILESSIISYLDLHDALQPIMDVLSQARGSQGPPRW